MGGWVERRSIEPKKPTYTKDLTINLESGSDSEENGKIMPRILGFRVFFIAYLKHIDTNSFLR